MMQRNVASIPGYRPGNEANTHSSGQVIVKDLDMFEKQNSVRSVAAKGYVHLHGYSPGDVPQELARKSWCLGHKVASEERRAWQGSLKSTSPSKLQTEHKNKN